MNKAEARIVGEILGYFLGAMLLFPLSNALLKLVGIHNEYLLMIFYFLNIPFAFLVYQLDKKISYQQGASKKQQVLYCSLIWGYAIFMITSYCILAKQGFVTGGIFNFG